MAYILTSLLVFSLAAAGADTDRDGIPDAVERKLAMDPRTPDELTLVLDDRAAGQGDKTLGRNLRDAYDFTRIYFGNVARDRWVWRVDFTKPPDLDKNVAFIIYVDADSDPATGRTGSSSVAGTDLMIRFGQVQAFGPMTAAAPRGATHIEGATAYLVVDAPVRQADGQSVFRFRTLSQARDRQGDSDHAGWVEVRGPGNTTREPVRVDPDHPLYSPPEAIAHVGATTFFDPGAPRAHVTWITSWPTLSKVEYGPTPACALAENTRVSEAHCASKRDSSTWRSTIGPTKARPQCRPPQTHHSRHQRFAGW